MNYNKSFKIIRAATGLAQFQFAKKIGIEPSLLSRIESGERKPTLMSLKLVSNKLSVPMELIELLAKEKNDLKQISNKKFARIGEELLGLVVNTRNE